MKENAKVGVVVAYINEAVDRDENDHVYYHVLRDDSGGKFVIRGKQLVLKSKLDRETASGFVGY